MKKLFTLCAAVLTLAACSTVPPAENLTMQEAELNLSSLKRDEYVILGRIAGEATATISSATLKSDIKKRTSGEPTAYSTVFPGDSGHYGFVGTKAATNMGITEKITAMATYNMLNTAKFNDADAVLYVTRQLQVTERGSKSVVTAKVSGVAIQLKADEGVEIKYPVLKTNSKAEDEEATEAEPETEEAEAPAPSDE